MGLKPDHWIRKMALEEKMIEPFVEGQVREGVISYGLSSYGYDMRIADEFKIFTNVYSAIVDPKSFSPQSFVDVKTEVCIIPPNSFALARSVELFKIPRKVLCVCLGKSTYARSGLVVNVTPFEPCFSDDTEILTPNGWQLIKNVNIGEEVLGMNDGGEAEWQPVLKKQIYIHDGPMIHFDGKSLDLLVTPEHKVFVRRRSTSRIRGTQQLRSYKTNWHTLEASKIVGKYNHEMLRKVNWQGVDIDDCITLGKYQFQTDTFLEFLGLYLGDGSCYVNKRGYLIKIAAFKERELTVGHEILTKLGVRFRRTETGYQFFSKPMYEILHPLGHAPEKYIPAWVKNLPPHRLERVLYGLMNSDGNLETETYTTTSKRLADDVQEIIFKAGFAAIVRQVTDDSEHELKGKKFKSTRPAYKVRLTRIHLDPKISPKTHKEVEYRGLVYDVTVPGHLIFVRRNGKPVWSGNCWEGYVTLEISNTTPLPAKVYANEGIAQVLFFEADEECEVSYADRKGKYQGQTGVTPPKL